MKIVHETFHTNNSSSHLISGIVLQEALSIGLVKQSSYHSQKQNNSELQTMFRPFTPLKAHSRILVHFIISAFLLFAYIYPNLTNPNKKTIEMSKIFSRYGNATDSFAHNAMTNIQLGD